MADSLAQMQALFEQHLSALPLEVAQQLRAEAQAIRDADQQRRAAEAEQEREESSREATRRDKLLMSKTKQNSAIRTLTIVTDKTPTNRAKKLLNPARLALTTLLNGAPTGENQAKLERFLTVVQELLQGGRQGLPNAGYVGKTRCTRLLDALQAELQLRPEDVDDDPEDDPVVGPGGQLVLWRPDQDDEPEEDEPDDFAAVERPQKSPDEFPGTPQPVVDVRCAQHASRGGRVYLLTDSIPYRDAGVQGHHGHRQAA